MTQTTPPTWSRVKAILADALELETARREAFLDEACAGQPALRRRVVGLIGAYTATGALADVDSPARNLPLQPTPGATLGRYRVSRLIGRGGMGAVYEAMDEQLGRPVAVKLLQSGVASRKMMKRFELEPKLLARLRHPAIAQIFETGTVSIDGESVPFFAMELVPDAMPITAYAESRGLFVPDRLRLFLRVCDAVTHGHQRRVIHRDLKPANILVDSAGNPKVIDFGVGRASDAGGAATTAAGELLGTVRYMSPEQVTGDPDDVDVRADVYALGVVLYELLCGQPPHPESKGGILASIREAEFRTPLPLSRLSPNLGGDIQTIALKAVAPLASARYQSVAELAADVMRFLNHEPISARPQSAVYHLRLFARRHRALVGGAAALVAALALGIIGTSIGLYRATKAEKSALAQSRRAERIAGFLKNTIRSADPGLLSSQALASLDPKVYVNETWLAPASTWGTAGPAEVGVKGLLRHAASHLETEFADDPLLQAEAAVLLAYTLSTLEDFTPALLLNERALSIQERILPADDEAIMRSRVLYASCLSYTGRPLEADEQLRLAAESSQRRFGAMDRRTLGIKVRRVGNLRLTPGQSGRALPMAYELLAEVSAAKGPDSAEAWLQHHAIVEVLRWPPFDREALIAECRATIDGLSRTVGAECAPVQRVCWSLAGVLMDDPATLAEAESLLRRALAIAESLYGPDGRECYETRSVLLTALMQQGRIAEAEPLAHEALESSLRMLGPHSLYTLKAKGRLARVLTWLEKDADQAEQLAREAAHGCELISLPGEDYTCYHDAIWAAALRLRGDPARAEAKLRDRIALRGPRAVQTDSGWVEAYEYLQLALCLADQHRSVEARDAIRTAARWAEALHEPLHPMLLNIRQVQARLDPEGPGS